MSEHLTHQELTDHLLGTRSATVEAHLAECSNCSKELYQFKESLEAFRGAVHSWSETVRVEQPKELPVPRSWDWLLVGAMAIVLVVFSVVYLRDRADTKIVVKQPAPAAVAENSETQIQQDNDLLSDINQELSEGLPSPMQPLQISTSNQTATNSSKTE